MLSRDILASLRSLHLSQSLLTSLRILHGHHTFLSITYHPVCCQTTGTVAFLFSEVTVIELSCCFDSISDLFRTIRSFKNVKDVRLTYPHHSPPQWIFSDQVHPAPGRSALPRRSLKIQNLEMSLTILKPVLDACGDVVVNLSVLCPQMSALSTDGVDGSEYPVLARPLTSLRTVKISVPVESDDPTNHAGLRKLSHLLLAPLSKPNVRYSLDLVRCPEHNTVGVRVSDTTSSHLQSLIQRLAEADPGMPQCHECSRKENPAPGRQGGQGGPYALAQVPAGVPDVTLTARSKLLEAVTSNSADIHRWTLLKNSMLRSRPAGGVDPAKELKVEELEARNESEAWDSFLPPGPSASGSPRTDSVAYEENWLESLLEDLGDGDDDFNIGVEGAGASSASGSQ